MEHIFHRTIRRVLDIDLAPGKLVWDRACGGSQWISLFDESTKSRGSRYSCADSALIIDDAVHMIFEIEEAGNGSFLPARITGKLCSAGLCRSFIPSGRSRAMPFAERVTFIQVLNRAGLKTRSQKRAQYANIERGIQERLMPLGSIAAYRLLLGDHEDFLSGDAGNQLRAVARAIVSERASK
jgi:hypothetical protein